MIPLSSPWITNGEIKKMIKGLKVPHLTDGPRLREFESLFAKKILSKFAVGVSNGTSAIHVSLLALGIGKGDEVIIPDMTFVATANAVILTGATPVLADINDDLNISIQSVKAKITKKTKAIIPVHFAGLSCNMEQIMKVGKKENLFIIEDAAHAFGTYFKGKHVGIFGHAGCFSFYPTKNITTIEGGMIVTNSKEIAKKSELLRNHGLSKTLEQRNKDTKPWDYDIEEPGYNYRLDEIRSILGKEQIIRSENIKKKRTSAAKYYNKKLKNIEGIEVVNLENENNHSYHLYIIRIKEEFGISRDELHRKLFKKGIRTTVHYKPLHKFTYLKNQYKKEDFKNSEKAFEECLSIPLFPTITRKEQDIVIKNIIQGKKL